MASPAPAAERFSIVVSEPECTRCRLRVRGELDGTTVVPLARVLGDLRAERRAVDIDLDGVTDAELAGMLPLWSACLDVRGPRVRIVAASAPVRSLVDVVLCLVTPDGTPTTRSSRPGGSQEGVDHDATEGCRGQARPQLDQPPHAVVGPDHLHEHPHEERREHQPHEP
jgi:hypothetical protein